MSHQSPRLKSSRNKLDGYSCTAAVLCLISLERAACFSVPLSSHVTQLVRVINRPVSPGPQGPGALVPPSSNGSSDRGSPPHKSARRRRAGGDGWKANAGTESSNGGLERQMVRLSSHGRRLRRRRPCRRGHGHGALGGPGNGDPAGLRSPPPRGPSRVPFAVHAPRHVSPSCHLNCSHPAVHDAPLRLRMIHMPRRFVFGCCLVGGTVEWSYRTWAANPGCRCCTLFDTGHMNCLHRHPAL